MRKKPDRLTRELPRWLNGVLIFGTLAALVLCELKRPLRREKENKLRRDTRNVAISLLAAGTVAAFEKPVTAPLSHWVQRRRFGLLKLMPLPAALELFLSVLLLDYTLFIWHYLTHKSPFLWRFHLAHHVDLDMDATTALRFHAGELLLSVPWRGGQVALLGISPLALALWQTLTLMEILFHHSNVRLPIEAERRLSRVMVTPRMHGIHHSMVREETDSNWSTIFSWPDYLHGTACLGVPQRSVVIGVPAYQDPRELTIGKVLKLPFAAQREDWTLAGDGEPHRGPLPPSTPE